MGPASFFMQRGGSNVDSLPLFGVEIEKAMRQLLAVMEVDQATSSEGGAVMTLEDRVYHQRLRLMHRAAELGNVSAACREAGVSRTLFYRLKARYERYGPDGLRPKDRRVPRQPNQTPPDIEAQVVRTALLLPTHGPARISYELQRANAGQLAVSASSVWRILRRWGLSTRFERLAAIEIHSAERVGLLTERTRRILGQVRARAQRHVEATRPGELVSIDAFYIGKLKGIGKLWQLTACDVACSFAHASLIVGNPTAAKTARFLRKILVPSYRCAGHRIEAVLTDNGPEFKGAFDEACRALGIRHRRIKPGHAWTNGFVERLQGTILTELWRVAFRRTFYTDVPTMQHDLDRYLLHYNTDRPHQGYRLRGKRPADLFSNNTTVQ